MIETFDVRLADDVVLSCRASGDRAAPRLVFLHGFPEAAFIWDPLLEHFADRYRCIAPNLRGFAPSSAPTDAQAYRTRHLVADLLGLVDATGTGPLAALVAHDWGGAVAWTFAARFPQRLQRLVIVNSPHPATFLREMQRTPAQQAASAYMNFLARPDAPALLAENDYARLWPMFENMGAGPGGTAASGERIVGGGWLDAATRERYRETWRGGLVGPCHYYTATPLRPPDGQQRMVMDLVLDPADVTVTVPTRVLWAEADLALLPALTDGLEAWVPRLSLVRVPGATHWLIHERPGFVAAQVDAFLAEPAPAPAAAPAPAPAPARR